MSKSTIILLVVLGVFGMYGCSTYNGLATQNQEVEAAWAKVQTQYQRRLDLIPNLVNTVQGAANFEKSTLTAVIEARSKATSIQLKADDITPENMAKFQEAQSQLSGALSRLMAVAENYPQLKATQNFSELQAQLEGTENRIAVERNNFNDIVKAFNQRVVTFPTNLLAGMFGFSKKGFFEADAAAQKAPTVKF
ncbi:MAG: LemA family protein [Spirosomataceae bacterium]